MTVHARMVRISRGELAVGYSLEKPITTDGKEKTVPVEDVLFRILDRLLEPKGVETV